MTELQRVLAALDGIGVVGPHQHHHAKAEVSRDAARVIRELAAEVERLKQERMTFVGSLADAGIRAEEAEDEAERLKQERDEALAARETYAMTARQDIIEKAKALDELEAFLRSDSVPGIWIEPRAESDEDPVYFAVIVDRTQIDEEGPTIAAAIRAALEKASGQGGK